MATTTSRGAPYPLGSDPNDAPGYIHQLATWVNDRPGIATLTTTQRNALTGAELWAGRHIWNTTTSRLEFYSGSIWLPTPMPGRILAALSQISATPAASSATSPADIDAANLAVTFTAPASGSVLIHLEGVLTTSGTLSNYGLVHWALRDSTTTVGDALVLKSAATGDAGRTHATFLKTGLTPGQSYTYKWAQYREAGGDAITSSLTVNSTSPAIMRVVEA